MSAEQVRAPPFGKKKQAAMFKNMTSTAQSWLSDILPSNVIFSVAVTHIYTGQQGGIDDLPQDILHVVGDARFQGCNECYDDSVCRYMHQKQKRACLVVVDCVNDPRTASSRFVKNGGLRTYVGTRLAFTTGVSLCALFKNILSEDTSLKVLRVLNCVRNVSNEATNLAVTNALCDESYTKMVQATEQFEKEAGELLQLIEAANVPIFGVDTEGRVNEWNLKTTHIMGVSREEATGVSLIQVFISSEHRQAVNNVLQRGLMGDATSNYELSLLTKSGRTCHLLINAATRRGVDGDITGVICIGQDITELLEAKRNAQQKSLESDIQKAIADRFRAACAYLSHEIRNQLFPQSMMLATMREEYPDSSATIDMILGANDTVTNILNKVLDLSKWDSGTFPVDSVFFPVVRLLRAVSDYASANSISVNSLNGIKDTWHVKADEHILKQACTNIVSNAVKHCGGSPITLTVGFERNTDREGVLVCIVEDKGRGMTPEQLEKALVPFGQIRKSSGKRRTGTGLGLPLTKAMVEIGHKGTLNLESRGCGQGTRATVRVPVEWIDYAPERFERDPLWYVALHPSATVDVLLADDDLMIRALLVIACKRLGLTYEEAADGVEANARMEKSLYHLAIIDNQMPNRNGADAIEIARAAGYDGTAVLVSGDTFQTSEEIELKKMGVTEVVSKLERPGVRDALIQLNKLKKGHFNVKNQN